MNLKLQQYGKSNQKFFLKGMINLRKEGTDQSMYVKDSKWNILTEEKEIIKRWWEYFKKLLTVEEK